MPLCAWETEGEGFEPSVDQRPTTVFETAPFNRSGTPPGRQILGGDAAAAGGPSTPRGEKGAE